MMNFAADGLVKERIGTMKNILNRSALFLFVLAFTLLAPQGARAAGYNVMDNDRILLMNNDSKLLSAITYQSYYDTNTANKTYWVHSTEAANILASWALKGTTHTMYKKDGTRLWHLVNCRAGSGTVLGPARNFIPWSTTAKSIKDGSSTKIQPTTAGVKTVGSVVMRNGEAAEQMHSHTLLRQKK